MEVRTDLNINPKEYFPDSKYIIEYAFSIGDKHYFRFSDPFNIPAKRALTTITFYREVELNIDRAYLKAHCEAVINCLTPTSERPTIEAGKALELERLLLTRSGLPPHSELVYKLASVVFFDQHEMPAQYEYEYAKKKIAFWKTDVTMTDFFLQMPLLKLIPSLTRAAENLEAYNDYIHQLNQMHNSRIRESLSRQQSMELNASSEWSQEET